VTAASVTVLAIGPGTSNCSSSGLAPERDVRPRVGLIPTIESRDAGTMIEPDVSVPMVVAAIELVAAIA